MGDESLLPRILDVPIIRDERGALAVFESGSFGIPLERVYFLFDVQAGSQRGAHAHKELTQVILAPSGSFSVKVDDGAEFQATFDMRDPSKGLLIPPGIWRELVDFSSGAVCLVLASAAYDESDYFRKFDEFLLWKSQS